MLLLASNGVSQITLEYTGCERATGESTDLPKWTYDLTSSNAKLSHATPQWQYDAGTKTCNVRFELPADLGKPVFLYYKLTNFYQNHRRYVRSLDTDQLKGTNRTADELDKSDCKPLGRDGAKALYLCGLIVNSMFNGGCSRSLSGRR